VYSPGLALAICLPRRLGSLISGTNGLLIVKTQVEEELACGELGEGLGCGGSGEGELDGDCVGSGEGVIGTTDIVPEFGECIATTKKVVPNANATKRKNRLEIVAATSAPKSLKLPPRRAINTRIAPKTNAPIFKSSGMNLL
jgi:hypothetical protein